MNATKTRADYRRHLNAEDAAALARGNHAMHYNGRFRQTKRLYGDYLYHQDRAKFEADYAEWISRP